MNLRVSKIVRVGAAKKNDGVVDKCANLSPTSPSACVR